MTQHTLCLTLLFLTPYTLACTHLPATAAFVVINDQNNDRALSWEEWEIANIDNNLIVNFKLGDETTFKEMDRNQDKQIEAREMGFQSVHYLQAPCERHQNHNRHSLMRTGGRNGFGFSTHPH